MWLAKPDYMIKADQNIKFYQYESICRLDNKSQQKEVLGLLHYQKK